jgi:hypothetical protein
VTPRRGDGSGLLRHALSAPSATITRSTAGRRDDYYSWAASSPAWITSHREQAEGHERRPRVCRRADRAVIDRTGRQRPAQRGSPFKPGYSHGRAMDDEGPTA